MLKKSFVIILVFIFFAITGCNQKGPKLATLETKEQQTEFIAQAKVRNAEQKNFSLKGEVTVSVNGQQGRINFHFDKNGESNSSIMNVKNLYVYNIQHEGKNYIGNQDSWVEIESEDSNNPIDISNIIDSNESLSREFEYKGVVDCGTSQCQAFNFGKGSDQSLVFFDGTNFLIRSLATKTSSVDAAFDFSYGNASVMAAPTNATKAEGLTGLGKLFEIYIPLFKEAGIDLSKTNL